MSEVIDYLRDCSKEAHVVFPLHPRTREACQRFGLSLEGLSVIEPISYLKMTALVISAKKVLTDSGGLQKEAFFHGVPCVTLRNETEWVETIEDGHNRLWKGEAYRVKRDKTHFGNGKAAEIIRDRILEFLNLN